MESVESEGSLLCSQQLMTSLYTVLYESNPQFLTLIP
jgi:hypothetical protein